MKNGDSKKKIICICNTYYQLIFAMQLKEKIYSEDYFVLLLSDHSRNAENVLEQVKTTGHFEEAYYVRVREIDNVITNPIVCYKRMKKNFITLSNFCYDEFLYFNISISSVFLFSLLYKANKCIECSRFEEGILTYNSSFGGYLPITIFRKINKIMYHIRKCVPSINVIDKTKNFYCYYPELYSGELIPKKVSMISVGSELGVKIVKAFQSDKTEELNKEKYIFFTSVYDFEGGESIGEFEVVKKIVDVVGKENIVIKTHPRDTRNIYEESGFHIAKNSAVPFEALLFMHDFSDKVLLTATSGAVLAAGLMIENSPQIYYMYPHCAVEKNEPAKHSVKLLEKILEAEYMKTKLKNIHICNDIEEIVE